MAPDLAGDERCGGVRTRLQGVTAWAERGMCSGSGGWDGGDWGACDEAYHWMERLLVFEHTVRCLLTMYPPVLIGAVLLDCTRIDTTPSRVGASACVTFRAPLPAALLL
jgi:hypothetical protein